MYTRAHKEIETCLWEISGHALSFQVQRLMFVLISWFSQYVFWGVVWDLSLFRSVFGGWGRGN